MAQLAFPTLFNYILQSSSADWVCSVVMEIAQFPKATEIIRIIAVLLLPFQQQSSTGTT